jgi:hypothetical protein
VRAEWMAKLTPGERRRSRRRRGRNTSARRPTLPFARPSKRWRLGRFGLATAVANGLQRTLSARPRFRVNDNGFRPAMVLE